VPPKAADCSKRRRLSAILAEAIVEAHSKSREYKAAKATKSEDQRKIAKALRHARNAMTVAGRNFREHVEQHGCKVK
jgi:hypothetical protein